MTPEEFAAKMRVLVEDGYCIDEDDGTSYFDDEEQTHITMDCLMCDLLRSLGYGEGIDIFENTPKWYA